MRSRVFFTAASGALALSVRCSALSPSYSGESPCPISCTEAGVSPGNWTVYHSIERLNYCNYSLVLSFSAFSPLDDPSIGNTLRACVVDHAQQHESATLSAEDFDAHTASSPKSIGNQLRSVNQTNALTTSLFAPTQALWNTEPPMANPMDIVGLGEKLQAFLGTLDASIENTAPNLVFIYNSILSLSIGLYTGTGVPVSPLLSALSTLVTSQRQLGGVLIQACSTLQINDTVASNNTSSSEDNHAISSAVGIVAAFGSQSLAEAQRAVSQWANSSCVTEGYAQASTLPTTLQTAAIARKHGHDVRLAKRETCSTTTVQSGDLCADLAKRCGISTEVLLKYNSKSDFCTTLRVPQLVCCSGGSLPVPEPDSSGNCKTHEVQSDESCWSIANDQSFLFSVDDLEDFNKRTWGWGGCKNLQASTIICLSPGNPPLPKPIPNAMCGPVKPGTQSPPPGTDLATLNPCPLNSCCDVWGFCGTTDEFCRPVPTGQAPGAPQPIGAPNCISNCGTDIVNNVSPSFTRLCRIKMLIRPIVITSFLFCEHWLLRGLWDFSKMSGYRYSQY